MGSSDLFKALTHTLKGGGASVLANEEIELTPYLSIVVAILYMMAVDGDISEHESSQLQSVIGADTTTLRRAAAYASSHEVDQFLNDAPPLLNARLRLCLLTNVCDSLMSDGVLAEVELALFDRLLTALGHTRQSFRAYYDAIAIKNRISVFGNFDEVPSAGALTPPLMLVASMLYMMSADGSLAEEEIGRLSTIVGNSQALLKAGLRYVAKVRAPQFLPLAAAALDETQRLCVLLNVCDAMMSDRQILLAEEQLLRRMLEAFGVEAKAFDGYLGILRVKNDTPRTEVQTRSAPEPAVRSRSTGSSREAGIVFERKRTWEEETGEAGEHAKAARQRAGAAKPEEVADGALSARISRTMQDNIDNLNDQFDSNLSLGAMTSNAREGEHRKPITDARNGPEDVRAYQDDHGAVHKEAPGHAGLLQPGRHLKDDATSRAGQHWKDDATSQPGRHWQDDAASQPGQHWKDDAKSQALAHWQDDSATEPDRHWKDDAKTRPGPHWQDAAMPGELRDLSDAGHRQPARHLIDDRNAPQKSALDDDTADCLNDILDRMASVGERTRTIRDYLDPMLSAKSIAAASRLPVLPVLPPRQLLMTADALQTITPPLVTCDEVQTHSQPMLLASDEGGPIMTQTPPPAQSEEGRLNRKLRQWSMVLFPALFLTYGTTMVGETASGHNFITSENLATDARTVHQMASVQQTVYRVTPEAVVLSTGRADTLNAGAVTASLTQGAAVTTAVEGSPSDREQADIALEQRKQALEAEVRRHQSASALAAERQEWFVYAKSIVLLGLGMALWGVLFRSMRMLHGASAAGIASLLLTANAYWLVFRF